MDTPNKKSAKTNSPKMPVKCGVENCNFNIDHKCHAKELEVNPIGDNIAPTSDATCCSTFINRDIQ
jgi:hypothetical protein